METAVQDNKHVANLTVRKRHVDKLDKYRLDYWVAKAQGKNPSISAMRGDPSTPVCYLVTTSSILNGYTHWFSPSQNWENAGPIIEKEHIDLVYMAESKIWTAYHKADFGSGVYSTTSCISIASSPLVAAMRAYVKSVFGEMVPINEPKLR